MSQDQVNPYLGPRTFEERHAHLFFGRDKEARRLLDTVISEPLILFYAPSGAGKSSIINARLIPGLRDEGFHILPTGRIGGALTDEAEQADNVYVYNLLSSIYQEQIPAEELPFTSLKEFLSQTRGRMDKPDAPLVLIVDQFEELVTTYQSYWPQRQWFFHQLHQALQADSRLWIVLALREDYVAAIEPYAANLPGHLITRHQMQRMRAPAALKAVLRPAADHGRPFAEGVAAGLVDNLRQIRTHDAGGSQMGEFVEPVQLQVVCYELWENLKDRPPAEITAADVAEMGDVDQALGDFYQRTLVDILATADLTELELRSWFESKLITEDGTRGTVYQGPEETAGLPNEAVRQLADHYLLRSEMRAGGTWYELVHDRLVTPILQSNAAWRESQGPALIAAEAWLKNNRDPESLYEGAQLKEALAKLDESTAEPLVQEFLFTSQEEEERRKAERDRQLREAQHEALRFQRRSIIAIGFAIIAVAALVLAGFAYLQAQESARQLRGLNNAHSAVLTVNADLEVANASNDSEAIANALATAEAAYASLANAQATVDSNSSSQGGGGAIIPTAGPTPSPEPSDTPVIAEQTPITEPEQATILDVPYLSQWSEDAGRYRSDDGPAALAMLLRAAGTVISVDDVYDYMPTRESEDFTTVPELMTAAQGNQLGTEHLSTASSGEAMTLLRSSIDGGKPFIALIRDYLLWKPVTGSDYGFGHRVLVVGYDDDGVYIHDSLLGIESRLANGAYLNIPPDLFVDGWGGSKIRDNPDFSGIFPLEPVASKVGPDSDTVEVARFANSSIKLLDVPYRSQHAEDADSHNADGGPTAITMLLNAMGVDITPNGLHQQMPTIGVDAFAKRSDMMAVAENNGMPMTYEVHNGQQAMAQLRAAINEGRPFMILADYEPWQDFTGNDLDEGAYLLVVGYDSENVYLHDPYYDPRLRPDVTGAYLKMPLDLFVEGWGGFPDGDNSAWSAIYPLDRVASPLDPDSDEYVAATVVRFTNNDGRTYYLHAREAELESGATETIYFFSSSISEGALSQIPAGYSISVTGSGLPLLSKE